MPEVSFREALAVWWRIGLLSFGGPAGQIALMHRILVDEKRWVDESRFLHALNYCMMLPGPEAQQLATYIGWLLHGVKGGLVAGILFILPGAVLILGLSLLYVLLGDVSLVQGLFFGLKAAVLAVVVQALLRISQKALKNRLAWLLAIAGFIALFAFNLPFPLVVLGAGLIGYLVARFSKTDSTAEPIVADVVVRPGTKTAALVCTLLWFATMLTLLMLLGGEQVFSQIALFFSKMAVVTFGGAYAVLGYVAQQGVEHYGWLQPGEMLDGLGLAETTPGPLILVTQFVGFLAAFREYGIWGGVLGALLTTWVTFLPCFVWIFAGAPYVEKLRSNLALSAALAAITAAVVGVIANLALWFAVNVLFAERIVLQGFGLQLQLPELSSLNPAMLAITLLACLLLFVFKRGLFVVLGSCALLGIGWQLLVG
ncbi:chromate efflux transporter [Alkalimonas amylolytica]|uniref:Chromate transporter n=1 Tax=Alkalimonas amylolytica TaxID=152573 RepID=A0A1H4CIQ0_ALKAM|nr:chromate efflux transporter [Alkalimonas amylolytica]SEA60301.1 chromate transporter [Alkalimonas amylolytica]